MSDYIIPPFGGRTPRIWANRRRRLILDAGGEEATLPDADGWDIGTDGANVLATYTDGSGGVNGTGIAPILDDIDNASRRCHHIDFSPDGLKMVVVSYSANIATYDLTVAYDPSTATPSGKLAGATLPAQCHFNEDGTYLSWQQSNDIMKIMALSTPYTISIGDTPSVDTLSETELMGYTSSSDNFHILHPDGTGVWGFGRVSVTDFTIVWTPLDTPYDFSTPGTPVISVTNETLLAAGAISGGLAVNTDGTEVQFFAGTYTDSMHNFTMGAAFDPTNAVRTASEEVNITTDFTTAAWSKDLTLLFMTTGPNAPSSIRVFGRK